MSQPAPDRPGLPQKEPLSEVASHLLEECRMVLPGIQALFGFQLIAVFNAKFWEMTHSHRVIHLVVIGLVAIAIALVMTPAAYHRAALKNARQPTIHRSVLPAFVVQHVSSHGRHMPGFYLIVTLILNNAWWGIGLCLGLLTVFMGLWIGLPYYSSSARTR
jgi:hypothetical protein